MEFRNRTREIFDWDTEDDLNCLLEPDHRRHPELAAEFPVVLLEEDIPGLVATMETEILEPNASAAEAADTSNSGIKNTTGVYDAINTLTPIFTINPTPEAEPNNEHEDNDDNKDDYDDENYEVK